MIIETNKNRSYYNLLLFTIISALISLALIIGLYFKGLTEYLTFIITVIVGIFFIICWCIYSILRTEYLMNLRKDTLNYTVSFDKCPDYYTQTRDSNGNITCLNNYSFTTPNGENYIIKIYPMTVSPSPNIYYNSANSSNIPKYESFPLKEISSTVSSYNDQCSIFSKNLSSTVPTNYIDYNNIPWTNIKSQCSLLSDVNN